MGRIVEQQVVYEWRPILCNKCKNFGHHEDECRRQEMDQAKKDIKGKIVQEMPQNQHKATSDGAEWTEIEGTKGLSPLQKVNTQAETRNSFDTLTLMEDIQDDTRSLRSGEVKRCTDPGKEGGGVSPLPDG